MDLNSLLTLKKAWGTFKQNHPKFPEFLKAVKKRGAVAGAELSITVSYPDGQVLRSGIKLKPEDVELINTVAGLM